MAIDDQIAIGTVLVLTDFRGDQWRLGDLGKPLGQKVPRSGDAFRARGPIAARRIELHASSIVRQLESPPVQVWKAVDDSLAEVDPDRKMARQVTFRTSRSSEVEALLSCRTDPVAENLGEKASEPRTAGEHIHIRLQSRTVLELQCRQRTADDGTRLRVRGAITSTGLVEGIADRNAGSPGRQSTCPSFEVCRFDSVEVDLRIPLRCVGDREFLDREAKFFENRQ